MAAELERGRNSYAAQAWMDAFESLSAADRESALGGEDLERLATAAYMIGRETGYIALLERAHRAHLAGGRPLRALRCAFWVGVSLARRGEAARASGWLARAERLLERDGGDRVERGYLLLAAVFEHEAGGHWDAAEATAGEAAAIGERFADADLFALAAHERGHILVSRGETRAGLKLLDEAMVAVTGDEVTPIPAGIVYCGVILACQAAHDVRRAQEWTAALSRWCDRQRDLVAFTGRCLVHRAEIMHLRGAWPDALAEARRALDRCVAAQNEAAAGEAAYREAEIHRLLGDCDLADSAYREASGRGRDPQPGLALLRLAQGNPGAAAAALRRVAREPASAPRRAAVLPGFVELTLAVGDVDGARRGAVELGELAEAQGADFLVAQAAHADGAVKLAGGEPEAALAALRRACELWQELEAPYEAARARELVGHACRRLGDEEGAALELEGARDTLRRLGARPDATRVAAALVDGGGGDGHGLTARELDVLRLVASGRSNRDIAAALVISEHTVARHLQNIYAKLGVSSRTAASAFAFEHRLA